MMKRIALFSILIAGMFLAGCGINPGSVVGSGNVVTEERAVSNFDQVALTGVGDLVITQGDQEALTIEAEDNLIPYIQTEVVNGKLSIGFKSENRPLSIRNTKPITFNLAVKQLKGLTISGSGNAAAASLAAADLSFAISGSGNVRVDHLTSQNLKASLSGSGNIDLGGKADTETLTLSGSGNFEAGELETQSASVIISGSGAARVWANQTLDLRISGSGNVEYYGQPEVTQTISGSGRVRSLGSH